MLEKARFYEYVVRDNVLLKALRKHKKKLHYATKRTKAHKELLGALTETLQLEPETLEEIDNQMQMLAALEQERIFLNLQTRFLLMADLVEELEIVDEVFFPEEI